MQPKTYVSLEELYNLYLSDETEPPEWLARMLGKPVKAAQPQAYLDHLVAESGIPSLFAAAEPSYEMLDTLSSGGGIYICGVRAIADTLEGDAE